MKKVCFLLFVIAEAFVVSAQELPADMPLIDITTDGGVEPTCRVVSAPEGCIGTSITDNNYVTGRMVMTINGDTLYDSGEYEKSVSGMRIKIRGNSTGAYLNQHPYKIKLSKKHDLLGLGNEFKHKEWLLLSMYTWNVKMTKEYSNVLNVAALLALDALGAEWTPRYDFVNVMMNGNYQGMYYLMEAVARGESRIDVSTTGFIIEHDPFFWNEDGRFFKTDRQAPSYGYTYKYPDKDDVTAQQQAEIQSYMNAFEDCLATGGDVAEYIDMESFARWVLVHDILGTDDGAGCNKFLYKYDLDPSTPLSSKMRIGPPWDYDSCFRIGEGKWSRVHTMTDFYYPALFARDDFRKEYVSQWNAVGTGLYDRLHEALEKEKERRAAVFDESIAIHNGKYPGEGVKSFCEQIDEIDELFRRRIADVAMLMKQYDDVENAIDVPRTAAGKAGLFSIDGRRVDETALPAGIYIERRSDGEIRKIIKK